MTLEEARAILLAAFLAAADVPPAWGDLIAAILDPRPAPSPDPDRSK